MKTIALLVFITLLALTGVAQANTHVWPAYAGEIVVVGGNPAIPAGETSFASDSPFHYEVTIWGGTSYVMTRGLVL